MPKEVHGGAGERELPKMVSGQSKIKQIVDITLKHEGIKGLYKGFGIHVFGGIPAGGLYYGSYELFKIYSLKNEFLQ